MLSTIAAGTSLAFWLVLALARGGFWRTRERLDDAPAEQTAWPAVVAVVPARNETDVIGLTIRSLVCQDYPGSFRVVLVDDHSTDGTASTAMAAALACGRAERLEIIRSAPLPGGWTGKLWALSEGLRHADRIAPGAPFVWFTDADVEHDPGSLRRLVGKAVAEDRDLVSLMVLLTCRSAWERLLIPPFVFFFAMLYPFAWIKDPRRHTAAAAGGCMLLRREALARAGGLAVIRHAIIDDCALARRIKDHGRLGGGSCWLGLTAKLRSVRPYEGLRGIWSMVARSAYTQLRCSDLLLAATVFGMCLVYLVPPLVAVAYPWHGDSRAAALAVSAWGLMVVLFWPMVRFYRLNPAWTALLPVAALFYCAMTIDSGIAHRRGRGGTWKGRLQGGSLENDIS